MRDKDPDNKEVGPVAFSNTRALELCRDAVAILRSNITDDVLTPTRQLIGDHKSPPHFVDFMNRLEELNGALSRGVHQPIDAHLLPYLKTAILNYRRRLAREIDQKKDKLTNAGLLDQLDGELEPCHTLAEQGWFKCKAARPPRLTEVLTLEAIENKNPKRGILLPRKLDEKFHTLMSPELFLSDLDYHLSSCSIREISLCVAFLDIDDFKLKFNSKFGETKVDRYVLFPFMQLLEGHVYAQGTAYRFGGDEYVILYPNADRFLAATLLYRFIDRLNQLQFSNISETMSVTIGLVEANSDSPFTPREILQKADEAKNYGKQKAQKGQVYGYSDESMDRPELVMRTA